MLSLTLVLFIIQMSVNNIAKTFILFVHFISVVNSGSVFIKYSNDNYQSCITGKIFLTVHK